MQKQEMTGKTICKKKVIHDNDLQRSDIVQHILKKFFCYNIVFLIKSDSILQSHWQKDQEQSLPWIKPWSVLPGRQHGWQGQKSEYFSFQISEYFVLVELKLKKEGFGSPRLAQ